MKTFDELWLLIRTAIESCRNSSELERLRVVVMGKNGIFKQIEKALWQ